VKPFSVHIAKHAYHHLLDLPIRLAGDVDQVHDLACIGANHPKFAVHGDLLLASSSAYRHA
jgi:hypothetical protein